MKWQFERAYYRIEYPIFERPWFDIGGRIHDVVDCSEAGLRYRLAGAAGGPPKIGDTISGQLRFRRGEQVEVAGRVVRVQDGQIALNLDPPGIPLKIIFDEQRFILKKYPQRQ